ncbi:OLC1v1009071C1 [Oldenlandia corymbosa var. corymbosa]|uniref:OLC1v1009071C1 n=1 Tax=Oldenlandia corymbosa var. corymbosa TaxID=529605 RepID=A0AAV1DNL9_OLDCO|nr:OLC1v1009071C1 [Oldenlandia corymbosa var. corymbosa]
MDSDSAKHHEQPFKRSKLSAEEDNPQEAEVDRISNLPDTIRCHILSFLPTKFAVGTSILSTHWKNLFALIPDLKLEFDDTLLLHPSKKRRVWGEKGDGNGFPGFVAGVMNRLMETASSIREFNLKCYGRYEDDDCFLSAVDAAVRLRVQTVCLNVSMNSSSSNRSLICSLNGCTTLVKLVLTSCLYSSTLVDLPVVLKFPNLKSLILEQVTISDDMELLLDGCPVLQQLEMFNCDFEIFEDTFRISVHSLKVLTLKFCNMFGELLIVVDTPELETLFYGGLLYERYSFVSNFTRICALELYVLWFDGEDSAAELSLPQFLTACSRVECLIFGQSTMETIYRLSLPLPKLCNLKMLRTRVAGMGSWNTLRRLIEGSPNLEMLTIDKGSSMIDGDYTCFLSPFEGVPYCLSSSITCIEIKSFEAQEEELKFIEYLLENGKVLKKMVFDNEFDWKQNDDVFKRILEAELKSKTCKIFG